jgi:hypothetical protein
MTFCSMGWQLSVPLRQLFLVQSLANKWAGLFGAGLAAANTGSRAMRILEAMVTRYSQQAKTAKILECLESEPLLGFGVPTLLQYRHTDRVKQVHQELLIVTSVYGCWRDSFLQLWLSFSALVFPAV